jgi:GH15 family glucan-1,4-alpha-glucosidase
MKAFGKCGGLASGATTDGLPPGEGVFLPCSFWLADNLALLGRTDEATTLGNFPQAFTHVSLVNTACNLAGDSGLAHHRAGHRWTPSG